LPVPGCGHVLINRFTVSCAAKNMKTTATLKDRAGSACSALVQRLRPRAYRDLVVTVPVNA